MKILIFAASLREGSFNKKLVNVAIPILHQLGCTVDHAHFSEFTVPLYNEDERKSKGLSPGALRFIERMQNADGTIIATPEYNFSIPGTLKNLIDWVSRQEPMPFANQLICLLSASPSLSRR